MSITRSNVLVFWPMTELKRQYLDVTIANPWVRLSSYTKDDVSRSMHVWSPYDFWQLPYFNYTNSVQACICFWSCFISKLHSDAIREEHLPIKVSHKFCTVSFESFQQTQNIFPEAHFVVSNIIILNNLKQLLLSSAIVNWVPLDWRQGFYRVSLSEIVFPVLGVSLRQDMMTQHFDTLEIS